MSTNARTILLLTALCAVILPSVSPAQSMNFTPTDEPEEIPRATEIPREGFWPTRTMMERIADRISEEMSDNYAFDEEQQGMTRELFGDTVLTWLDENRAEIQTLTNQFFEAQLHDEPPTIDGVAMWSKRVLRIAESFDNEVITELTDGMREYMTEDQELQLDAEFAAYETAMGFMENKLGIWADGGYDPESEWLPPGRERRQREREERQLRREAMQEARESVLAEGNPQEMESVEREVARSPLARRATSQPKDEWQKYTEEFIARYGLDDAQKQKAMSYLLSAQEGRDNYLRTRSGRIDEVQKQLAAAQTETTRKKALAEFEKLNAPIDRRFQQLKEKLNSLPTRAQRRAAAERETDD